MDKPYYQDNHDTLYCLDFRKNDLPDEIVQMVVTSPPYWGLRKYAGEQELIWGDNHCEHQWVSREWLMHNGRGDAQKSGKYSTQEAIPDMPHQDNTCSLCGAWKGAYGLEPTPEMYVQHTIEILREIRRVLRKDGVVFWNIGDSYAAGGGTQVVQTKNASHGLAGYRHKTPMIKTKDLCLIPQRIMIAAQSDGWWVRSVIIWSKPNPMPESVTDRPTESHEYILMLTKSGKYYWDADAVREPWVPRESDIARALNGSYRYQGKHKNGYDLATSRADHLNAHATGQPIGDPTRGRNLRTVWTFPTQPYPEAHFAVFPERLPELCIKAATPEVGCCAKCGAPWERILEERFTTHDGKTKSKSDPKDKSNNGAYGRLALLRQAARERGFEYTSEAKTLGWRPTCKCNTIKPPVPSIVLDPFTGAGTTLWVAKKLNRKAVGYDISEEYCQLAIKRNQQQAFNLS